MPVVLGLSLSLNLIGCSPKWKAPVESRTSHSYPASSKRPAHYHVRRGDTLAVIAWRWGMDWRALAAWNDIRSPYTIFPGQRLRLTPPKRVVRSRMPVPAGRSKPGPGTIATVPNSKPNANKPSRTEPLPSPSVVQENYPQRLRWTWPAKGQILSTYVPANEAHKGIKIGGAKGRSIAAAEAGKVVYSGSGLIGYGRLIIIKHNNEFLSAYGHNRKLLVKEGDWVAKGDKIAEMGLANNGQAMLHFEIRRNGKPVNPVALLPRRAG